MRKYYLFFLQLIRIPLVYYAIAPFIFLTIYFLLKRCKQSNRVIVASVISYLFLVLSITVLNRKAGNTYQYSLTPFWSYQAIAQGGVRGITLKKSVLFNLLLLIPVGALLPTVFENRKWRTVLIGLGFSCLVELLQLITKRGLCELDDIIHNTLGCIIGYGIYNAVRLLISLHHVNMDA